MALLWAVRYVRVILESSIIMLYLDKGADQLVHTALVARGETERSEMRKINLELPHHVIGAPQPEQLLRGVGLVGLGQLRAVWGVILLL